MKLKKLSMVGFKSFMEKIEIPFPYGISAVVGPNGCGKSNIVDAIRWALGEQSARQLRGRNMEDVIFNGAGEYKPLGMAEVSLIFENGDGSFPGEYANEHEISVTRRLYRSGESEYLINGVPCRLKDIHEIFMDTGLGNKSYSIIGQGRIGSIVEQKPEETRMMLEEAAGITKFKNKEAEARRKMELTKNNLHRVEDILVEVQSQMRSLKRQSGKAKRYKEIGKEIQRLELILDSNTYNELNDNSGKNQKSTEDLISQEVALTAEYSRIQSDIEKMNLELDEKDQIISNLRNTHSNIKDEFARKEAALETLASEKKMQAELEERLSQESEAIKQRILKLNEEKALLFEKAESLKESSKATEEEILVIENRLKRRKELLSEIKEEHERANRKVSSGATKEAGLNQKTGYLNQRIEEITDSRTRLENEIQEIDAKKAVLLETSRGKNEVRQALVEKLEDIERDIQEKQNKFEEIKGIKRSLEADLKSMENELSVSETRLSGLRSLTDNFEGYQVGVRTIMKAKDLSIKNEGRVLGLVADIIQVESEYEQAVEAVLADRLQYVIVESQDDGKEAVRYLKEKAKGRSSFISLKDLNGNNNGVKQNGFPLLRDLVKVSTDSYKPLVDLLLGNTALADDLETAVSAWRNNGRNTTLVTPDGDLIDRNGIISGGRLTNGPHGLLTRKREIDELEKRVAHFSKEVNILKERLDGINNDEEENTVILGRLSREKSECQESLNDLDKIIFRVSNELDQLERLSERLTKELEDKNSAHIRHTDELSRIRVELRECEENKQKEEEYLLQKANELRECEQEYDEIRSELERIKMEHNLAGEERKGFLREIERIENYIDESGNKLDSIAREISSAEEKQHEYESRENSLRENITAYYDRLRQSEERLNQAQLERNDFHEKIRDQEKKNESVREERDLIKEKINLARMEQSEIRIKIENLMSRVRERNNIDLKEVHREYLNEEYSEAETRDRLDHQKTLRERLGEVNLTAIQEYEAQKERFDFITAQRDDLLKSIDSIMQAIRKINRTCLEKFMEIFHETDSKLKQVFPILFNGGTASLKLTDEARPLESGVLVEVRPPGKKLSYMGLLSGGEKAMVAMALLFAIYLIKPSPFCLLDEVDAPLDEANIDRFNDLLKEIRKYSQILMVTHNRRSMEIVDSLYGVTMENAGVSKMVSVNLNNSSSMN